jgi:hypothetical protein
MGQIQAPVVEPVRIGQSTSNAPPPQKEHIQAQSVGHDKPEWSNTTSLSPPGMRIQFRTLLFDSRPEEQLQDPLRLKKSVTSLPTAIGALCYPLGPHQENDLTTDLYSGSTSIANMDESNHWISFNYLNKSAISLSAAIEASGSPLGHRIERDLATDLYSNSILIAIKDKSNHRISFR